MQAQQPADQQAQAQPFAPASCWLAQQQLQDKLQKLQQVQRECQELTQSIEHKLQQPNHYVLKEQQRLDAEQQLREVQGKLQHQDLQMQEVQQQLKLLAEQPPDYLRLVNLQLASAQASCWPSAAVARPLARRMHWVCV